MRICPELESCDTPLPSRAGSILLIELFYEVDALSQFAFAASDEPGRIRKNHEAIRSGTGDSTASSVLHNGSLRSRKWGNQVVDS